MFLGHLWTHEYICRKVYRPQILAPQGGEIAFSLDTISPELSLQISVLHCNGGADIRSTPKRTAFLVGYMSLSSLHVKWTMDIVHGHISNGDCP